MSSVRIDRAGMVHMCVTLAGVRAATVRVWIARGLITQYPDGFDPDEVMEWITTVRDVGKARGAVLAVHSRTTRRSA